MHVFDQTNMYITVKNEVTGLNEMLSDDTPIRYSENGTKLGYCFEDFDITSGDILNSGSYMARQKSCRAHTGNAGNWYTWVTATSGGDVDEDNSSYNSVCSRGWEVPLGDETGNKSWRHFVKQVYGINDNENNIRLLPLSLDRSGRYKEESVKERGYYGSLWSSKRRNNSNYNLYFGVGFLNVRYGDGHYLGDSLRCGEKESLGEYGSGWGWENDYAETIHAFDQTNMYIEEVGVIIPDNTPVRFIYGDKEIHYCFDDIETTDGGLLFSGSVMHKQISCTPNVGNSGNYYSWNLSVTGGADSVCPRGWQVPIGTKGTPNSFDDLIRLKYGIYENADKTIRAVPLSFFGTGYYTKGSYYLRATHGNYWTATPEKSSAISFYFHQTNLSPASTHLMGDGSSLRWVDK